MALSDTVRPLGCNETSQSARHIPSWTAEHVDSGATTTVICQTDDATVWVSHTTRADWLDSLFQRCNLYCVVETAVLTRFWCVRAHKFESICCDGVGNPLSPSPYRFMHSRVFFSFHFVYSVLEGRPGTPTVRLVVHKLPARADHRSFGAAACFYSFCCCFCCLLLLFIQHKHHHDDRKWVTMTNRVYAEQQSLA